MKSKSTAKAAASVKHPKAKGKVSAVARKADGKGEASPRRRVIADSTAMKVRKMVVDKPEIEYKEVARRLGGKHKEGDHAWNIYNHARQVMSLVSARG